MGTWGRLLRILAGLFLGMCLLWAAGGLLLIWQGFGRDSVEWKPTIWTWLCGFFGGVLAVATCLVTGYVLLRQSRVVGHAEPGGTGNNLSSRRTGWAAPVVVLIPIAAVVGYFGIRELNYDSAAPPPRLTLEQLSRRKLLFDGETTAGWKIDGPAQVSEGTLMLGGDQPATARILREFDPGDRLQFHFFHEGPGVYPQDAVLRTELIFLNPDDPHSRQQGPLDAELRWKGLTPDGGARTWHECNIQSTHNAHQFELAINLKQKVGREGRPLIASTIGTTDGCRFAVVIATGPGNKLYLRNVNVAEAPEKRAHLRVDADALCGIIPVPGSGPIVPLSMNVAVARRFGQRRGNPREMR